MKTDISRLPSADLKHYLNVFLQMGRVQLDSDWNEQSELGLRLQQRHAADTVRTGSPNHGFRVDDRILLDAMDSRAGWAAEKAVGDPDAHLYVDYFDHRTGEGSLSVEGATALMRALPRPIDLSGLSEVVVAAKGSFNAANCVVTLGRQGTRVSLTTSEAAPLAGWRIFRATGVPGGFDLAGVDEYGLTNLDKTFRYQFDFVKIDRPIRLVLAPASSLAGFGATPLAVNDVPQLEIDDDQRRFASTVLAVGRAGSVTYTFPVVRDLRRVRRLILAARSSTANAAITVRLIDVADTEVTIVGPTTTGAADTWQEWAAAVPQIAFDPGQVKAIRWDGLTANDYLFSPVLLEMELNGNLVIMGGDGTAAGAGRFYGDGLAAVKESHETYFSQRDLPAADPAPLAPPAEGMARIDLAYLDLWERPVTYLEDPEIREIALEGPDTCTRMQLVAQVRILEGAEVAIGTTPVPPLAAFDALPACGSGTLTTKDNPAAVLDPCADPCEPAVAGTFVGEENRLFRVEIHTAGAVGPAEAGTTATFKWSRENGAVASALIEAGAAAGFTARVEKPELFREGDLIEIGDDLEDLITGPYLDRSQTRGELRRLTSIKLQDRLVSWEDATAADPAMHAALGRTYRVAHHAKVRRWDGLLAATSGDIVLADGVVIELGGSGFLPGDFWVFASRVADRSVERLIEARPRGICHRHYPLATIARQRQGGVETVVVDDHRATFTPLTGLRATDVSFDPGGCTHADDPEWAQVSTVQEAIDAICRMDLNADVRSHNKYLHGYGVVCGLKVRCNADRQRITLERGYALDGEGNPIEVRTPQAFDVVAAALQHQPPLLDQNGNGDVCLTLRRGTVQDATLEVEPETTQSFWDSVLEGTLLLDFYQDCIESLLDFLKLRFVDDPLDTRVVPDTQRRATTALNLLWQLVNPSSGRYVFLSPVEHAFLRDFYDELRARLQSETFCAMFDDAAPFPVYPYGQTPGIQTAFGPFPGAGLGVHRRMRLHPGGAFAYTCGFDNEIHVYDLAAGAVVQRVIFPGGANVDVQDVAFSTDGSQLHAVALNGPDSIFATAAIGADQSHTWGPTSVVCDIKFVTLATTPTHPNTLYAIGKAQGLYALNPAAIPVAPVAAVAFNATGILRLSPDGTMAFAAQNTAFAIGQERPDFDRFRSIDLGNPAAAPSFFINVAGPDVDNDAAVHAGSLYVTATAAPGQKRVVVFNAATAVQTAVVNLPGPNSMVRLGVLPGPGILLVALADTYRVVRINTSTNSLVGTYRIPVQIIPLDIAANAAGTQVHVHNLLSNTISIVSVGTVITAVSLPSFTIEPPASLSTYRQAILTAYGDLLQGFGQYLKDCFCDKFLVACPDGGPDDKVYLGGVEIRNRQVYNICNFTRRRYVKSVQHWEYWLSTVPVLPLLKKAVADFCCRVL
ncbi:MAG: DUF6519 domain-containing protein [Candidatus Rokuibacteriota bacterium]